MLLLAIGYANVLFCMHNRVKKRRRRKKTLCLEDIAYSWMPLNGLFSEELRTALVEQEKQESTSICPMSRSCKKHINDWAKQIPVCRCKACSILCKNLLKEKSSIVQGAFCDNLFLEEESEKEVFQDESPEIISSDMFSVVACVGDESVTVFDLINNSLYTLKLQGKFAWGGIMQHFLEIEYEDCTGEVFDLLHNKKFSVKFRNRERVRASIIRYRFFVVYYDKKIDIFDLHNDGKQYSLQVYEEEIGIRDLHILNNRFFVIEDSNRKCGLIDFFAKCKKIYVQNMVQLKDKEIIGRAIREDRFLDIMYEDDTVDSLLIKKLLANSSCVIL